MELYNYIFISVSGLLLIIFLHDVFQKKHTILRIFPVVGHLRYLLEIIGHDLINDITWIGSAKLGFPDRAVVAFAMVCDLINIARESMLSIGCIQAQKCHTGHCPSGVATHNAWLIRGMDVKTKSKRAAQYLQGLRKEILQLTYACG